MSTLLLLRHAPVAGGTGRCLGCRTDLPADPAGLVAAGALRELTAAWGVQTVYSSPMLRCMQTASAISGGRRVAPVPDLREQDCGAWDGLDFAAIRARWPEHYARRGEDLSLPPPGGEAPAQLARRGLDALAGLMQRSEGPVLTVAHAGLNRAVLCALLGLPFASMYTLPQPYLCANVLRWDGESFAVAAVGCPTEDWRSVPLLSPEKEELTP
ncbi:MAG: histidine phosphatase family protein [Ruminococcaceae bacterium]|nr:histidine phosphatase family protein [Oscillospiraceae bacterium]